MKPKLNQQLINSENLINSSKNSDYLENFIDLKTSVSFLVNQNNAKIIQFTSSDYHEDKSSIIANLTSMFSLSGKRVLLIDSDFRNPVLEKLLGMDDKLRTGFSDVLNNPEKITESTLTTSIDGHSFDFLTAGLQTENYISLLGNSNLESLFESLKNSYDLIFVDSAPIGLYSDAIELSSFVDGVIFILKGNHTKKVDAQWSIKKLNLSEAKLLGTIVSDLK